MPRTKKADNKAAPKVASGSWKEFGELLKSQGLTYRATIAHTPAKVSGKFDKGFEAKTLNMLFISMGVISKEACEKIQRGAAGRTCN